MRIKLTLKIVLLVLAIGTFWSIQAGAYGLFTAEPAESGQCSQCHLDWPGETHSVHTSFSCSLCHVDEEPVPSNACSGCHTASEVLELHSPLVGPGDQKYCGYCHQGTANDVRTLDQIKALYQ